MKTLLRATARLAMVLVVLTALFVDSPARADDEDDEMVQYHRDLILHRDELAATADDPNASELDRIAARERLDQIKLQIGNLEKEMERKGIQFVRAKPGEEVKAEDAPAGAQTQKAAGSPCDRYEDFERPKTSAWRLPAMNAQSGSQRDLARAINSTEDQLIKHTLHCEDEWTYQKAKDWAGLRNLLADTLIDLERRYALTFAGRYSETEDAILLNAYKGRPEVRRLVVEERQLYAKYMAIKKKNDAIRDKFGGKIPDLGAKLRRDQGLAMEVRARAAWRKVASRWNLLLRTELPDIALVKDKQMLRGVAEMKKLHPGTDFSLHTAQDFLDTKSAVFIRLLGKKGKVIVIQEGARRRTAISRRR